ncbi:DUF551 domain-containing protein [Klebsiella quasipneumoniae]
MTSKLARERLEKIKSWRETYGAGSNVMLPAEEAEELACIALAAMDSKPVAWTDEHELRDVDRGGCGYLFTVNPVTPHADERRIILLYRHAQPVPVVLDEVTAEDCPAFVKYDVTEVDEAWVRGFNACRAATLQASNCRENSNSSTNNFREMLETSTNSPVIPDTWIPVSERMPDENAEQQVLACFKGGDISTLYYFEGRWDDAYGIVPIRQDVTHWMPPPAAPQEVKGE